MSQFKEFALPQALEKALEALNYQTPTPIQEKAIPIALSNRDLIGCAQTGTGKTAAFSIPMIVRLSKKPGKRALILAPTRELAIQIEKVVQGLAQGTPQMHTALLIGGMSMQPQIRALQKQPRVLVATPGRLVDHLHRGTVSLSAVEILVLDEADRMLDMGFQPQLNEIQRFLPKARQTLMFSATLPPDILKLSQKYLKDPVQVTIGKVSEPTQQVSQSVVETTVAAKRDTLMDELNKREGSVLVFARTKARTDRVARYLAEYGHRVGRIHGDRSQKQRVDAIEGFRSGKFRILVATDIAARGIDISDIAHVINFDLPSQAEDYIHRIGRTGRAGAVGSALSLLTPEDRSQWREISRLVEAAKRTDKSAPGAQHPQRQQATQNPQFRTAHPARPVPRARGRNA